MDKDTTFVAIDDSKRTLVVGILRPGAREPELREIPNEPKLIRRLCKRLTREGPVRACYEAGVSGYDLYRQITALGVSCQVIAPHGFLYGKHVMAYLPQFRNHGSSHVLVDEQTHPSILHVGNR